MCSCETQLIIQKLIVIVKGEQTIHTLLRFTTVVICINLIDNK
jgi:hypothetical protein